MARREAARQRQKAETKVRDHGLLKWSPAELVIDAGADQVFGEGYLAVGGIGTAQRTGRTADIAQIDVKIFRLGADRVGKEIFDADAPLARSSQCPPPSRR